MTMVNSTEEEKREAKKKEKKIRVKERKGTCRQKL